MGTCKKIVAGVLGVALIAGAGVGIGCATNKNFKEKVKNTLKFETKSEKKLKSQVEDLQKQLDELQTANTTIETLKAEKEELQLQITSNATEINNLKAEKLRLEEQLKTTLSEEKAQELRTRITNLEARVTVLEAKEVELTNKVLTLETQITSLNREVDELWQLIVENEIVNENLTQNRIAKLEEDLSEKQEQKTQKETRKNNVQIEINNIRKQIETTENADVLTELERRVAELESEFNTLQIEINNLSKDISELENKINSLRNLMNKNDKDDDATVMTFNLLGQELSFRKGMTWTEWINSEYSAETGGTESWSVNEDFNQIYFGMDNVYFTIYNTSPTSQIQPKEYYLSRLSDIEKEEKTFAGENLIEFNVNGTNFQAEADMTFEQWVNSEYNTANFYIKQGCVGIPEIGMTTALYDSSIDNFVAPATKIDTKTYALLLVLVPAEEEPSATYSFAINDVNQITDRQDITWEEWVNSQYNTSGYTITDEGYIQDRAGNYLSYLAVENFKINASDKIMIGNNHLIIAENEFYVGVDLGSFFDILKTRGGMTWGDWINSEYKAYGYELTADGSIYNSLRGGYVVTKQIDTSRIKTTDSMSAETNYCLLDENQFFMRIDGYDTLFKVEQGMKWGDYLTYLKSHNYSFTTVEYTYDVSGRVEKKTVITSSKDSDYCLANNKVGAINYISPSDEVAPMTYYFVRNTNLK